MKLVLLAFTALLFSISPITFAKEKVDSSEFVQELEKKQIKNVKKFIFIDKDKRKKSLKSVPYKS